MVKINLMPLAARLQNTQIKISQKNAEQQKNKQRVMTHLQKCKQDVEALATDLNRQHSAWTINNISINQESCTFTMIMPTDLALSINSCDFTISLSSEEFMASSSFNNEVKKLYLGEENAYSLVHSITDYIVTTIDLNLMKKFEE